MAKSRIVIEVYPNTHPTAYANLLGAVQEWAESYGYYAHTSTSNKEPETTRVDITRSSRETVDIAPDAAQYLIRAAKAKGMTVEQLIREAVK